jgi:C4-dicarboxylate transporter DctM subunit
VNPVLVGFIGFAVLFALLALRMPIGSAMALIGFCGIWHLISAQAALTKVAVVSFETVANYELAVLPLFLVMAHIIFSTGMGRDLFDLAHKWLGSRPGGVAMAAVVGCAGFSAVSASSIATAATMGLIALPEMKRLKYDPGLATGSMAAGGTMGILIPPSSILIIYGILTETSIGKLFIAGIVPGVIEALLYVVTIYLTCVMKPRLGPRGERYSFKEKLSVFKNCGEIIGLIIFVMAGLFLGWFTPTEAGAAGALGAILFSLIRNRLTWEKLNAAFLETVKTTGMVYLILIGALILNYFVTLTQIPFVVTEYIGSLPLPPKAVFALVMLMYFGLGCFLDAMAMTVLTTPIFFPIAMSLGFDPLWFGVLVVMAMEIAMITPPIGMNVFVISGIAQDVPMQTIFRGILPFLIADIFLVMLLILVPEIVLFLPNVMR